MPSGTHVDHLAVHRALFERADHLGCVVIHQSELARELGVNKFTMSRVISQMVADERMRQITKRQYRWGKFKVTDPQVWQNMHGTEDDGE